MVARTTIEQNCFSPRDYQVELLDKACKRNVIVQLGTGSGKTFIAVLLLKEYGVQLYAPFGNGGKRAFFIVNQVNLVDQQADHIACHTTFNVGRMHGNLNSDIWNKKKEFQKFLAEHHVIAITAQVLLDLLNHAFLSLDDVCVLIFDECHHALGSGHPYRQIMSNYRDLQNENKPVPRVLGLTASLIKEKIAPSKLEEKLVKLEAVLVSSIETASDFVSLSKYGARPLEAVVDCRYFSWSDLKVLEDAEDFLKDSLDFVMKTNDFNPDLDLDPRRPIRDSFERTRAILHQLGPWAAWRICPLYEKQLTKCMRESFLPEKSLNFLSLARTTIIAVRRILERKMRPINSIDGLRSFVPHKIMRLFEMLEVFNPEYQANRMGRTGKDGNPEPEKLCGIIFVDQRLVAYVLHVLLKQVRNWDPRFKFIQPDYVVGSSGRNVTEDQGLQKRQSEVLRKFHRGDVNLLIATNVLEEGVDVKQCNFVVKFDRPKDMRSYIQSKGRARRPGARYIVLVEETDAVGCSTDFQDFKHIENLLLRRFRSVHNPVEVDVQLLADVDDRFHPYIVPSTGAKVKMSSAIELVNRYCSKLPSDIFTRLVPQNRIIPVVVAGVTRYCAELLLPINSPIKNAIKLTTPVESKKIAQMAVALEACKQLHQKGELDDHLLPKGRESIAKTLEYLDEAPDEVVEGPAKVGSAKRKQYYDKKMAQILGRALPKVGQECYIYVLDMERIKEAEASTNPKKRKFVNPDDYEYCFGFLSSEKFPKIPAFPIYLRQGDMRVSLKLAQQTVILSEKELHDIERFHDYLFTQVLQLCKMLLKFEIGEETPINTLIVPLNKNSSAGITSYSINFGYVLDVVKNMRCMPHAPIEETRKNFKFNAEDYKDAIVMPWYRNVENPAFYYVAEILPDMRPSSAFPDENYTTFNEYFIKKYQLKIYDQNQSLLDVDFTSTRLNLLLPRIITVKKRPTGGSTSTSASTSSVVAATPSASDTSVAPNPQRQILVPELMDIHPISATLWNLISALPSIFYRVNSLLVADELRLQIMMNAFGKTEADATVSKDLDWAPLTYPSTYEEKQSLIVNKIQQLRELNRQNDVKEEVVSDDKKQVKAGFDIGVWDPEDAERIGVPVSLVSHAVVPEGEEDTVGLMHGSSIPDELSDEDEDMNFVNFDYTSHLNFKNEEQNVKCEFAKPREDIVSSGWGDLDDMPFDSPFQIVNDSGSMGVNLSALMADVESIVVPSPKSNNQTEVSERQPTPPDERASREQIEKLKQVQRDFDRMDHMSDDRDVAKRVEETIDLESFDDGPDENNVITEVTSTSDDEFDALVDGERAKKTQDEEAFAHEVIVKETGVLAPEADFRFSFDKESPLATQLRVSESLHSNAIVGYGVSPCLLLAALTTSNASDGICLERLETIGDSFLKYAVTDFLYHEHVDQHEGKLSFARSKEVSNCNLYRLGKKLKIGQMMIAGKFDAHDAWLPPCYRAGEERAPNADETDTQDNENEKILNGEQVQIEEKAMTGWDVDEKESRKTADGVETITFSKNKTLGGNEEPPLPYNMHLQQHISDKSIADAVEALIGAHLLALGPQSTLHVMKWMGLKVLSSKKEQSPLLRFVDTPEEPKLSQRLLDNLWVQFQFSKLEEKLGYRFNQKAYLVQAFTHASYINNRITGCYQRLEFLGDAVLDYMITRFLFEDVRQYSPGVLTDLRSALVNNTIFASLAVKYDFQKHFIAMCPGLHHMIEKFVKLCTERNFFDANFNAEMYMVTTEEEIDEGQEEDIEVPKAMSDIFESVAGAIYLDCDRNLDVVWRVIYNLMKETISECCANPPRSPIRELMELESSKARFSKMERIIESGKVRVTVEVGNKMRFTGMGRNYRIAKTTAAKRALRYLKSLEEQKLKNQHSRP